MRKLFVRLAPLSLLSAFSLGSAAPASAQDAPEASPAAAYRQEVMKGLQAHRAAMSAVLEGEAGTAEHVLGHARAVYGLAMMASDIFAEGTGGPGSRAREEIWSNSADFAEAVSALQTAAQALVAAAESGDMSAVQESAQELGGTCSGCHRAFRARAGG